MRASDKLLATFSRAAYSGVAQTFNLAFSRLQLAAARNLPLAAFPFAALRVPYLFEPRSRTNLTAHRRAPFAEASLVQSLAAAFADSSQDELRARGGKGSTRKAVAGGG